MNFQILATPLPVLAWLAFAWLSWVEDSKPMAVGSILWLVGLLVGVYGS